ncbi:hypothetical protein BDA96_07G071200 [Sorghum bicolor]|jgi:hypothetical protein|uniref:Uncharacterized protein n=1 Tax=Sorghum bicolor TaxID=4558 RepID=A0A921QJ16_SORBI|nr:hypothetical protein BDA96_07G071200 [Sorghum bicolor]
METSYSLDGIYIGTIIVDFTSRSDYWMRFISIPSLMTSHRGASKEFLRHFNMYELFLMDNGFAYADNLSITLYIYI